MENLENYFSYCTGHRARGSAYLNQDLINTLKGFPLFLIERAFAIFTIIMYLTVSLDLKHKFSYAFEFYLMAISNIIHLFIYLFSWLVS